MKIEIPFEIGEKVWFIHPKSMKAGQSILKGLKVDIEMTETNTEKKIKYQLDIPPLPNGEKFYVWNVFKTKEDLLKSL